MEVNNEIAIQESGNFETFDRVNVAPQPHHYGHIRTNKDGDDDSHKDGCGTCDYGSVFPYFAF